MNVEPFDYDVRNLHEQCRQHMYHDVVLTMRDGNSFHGIIEDVGTDDMGVLVGEDVMEREDELDGDPRQFFGGGYGRPRRRFRRYRRRRFPLGSLAALALLPYIAPPYYPYYPYY